MKLSRKEWILAMKTMLSVVALMGAMVATSASAHVAAEVDTNLLIDATSEATAPETSGQDIRLAFKVSSG
jgi:surface antigen